MKKTLPQITAMRTFMAVILFVNSFQAYSQITQHEFNTGYVIQNNYANDVYPKMTLKNDKLFFEYFISISNNAMDQRISMELDTGTLNFINTQLLWDRGVKPIHSVVVNGRLNYAPPVLKVLHDDKYNIDFFIETRTDTNLNLELEWYNYANGNKSNLVGSLYLNQRNLMSEPFLYDSTFYIYTSNIGNTNDTAFLYSYNLRNQFLDSNHFTYTGWPNGMNFLNYENNYGPTSVYKPNDSLLTFNDWVGSGIQLVNRHTLDTTSLLALSQTQMNFLFNNYKWGTRHSSVYIFTDTSYIVAGTLLKIPYFNYQSFKYFYLEYGYDKSIKSFKEYGSDQIDLRAYGFTMKNDSKYFVGSTPFRVSVFEAAENRQVLVYKDSPQGLDSILLYGNKNHVGLTIEVDSEENVYVLSQYSNAWTNDSLYLVVTKIPASLLTSIRKISSKTTSIEIYPNPTTEVLKST